MQDPDHIYNWRRLDARITTSGQPSERQLAELAALGVTKVINLGLHTHEKALADEAASVAALDMVYTHIPVEFDAPTEEDFASFCVAMAQAQAQDVHIHCIANLRVSAFFYRYHTEILGINPAQARAIMESLWQPGGVWAQFIGDHDASDRAHRYASQDY